MRGSRFILAVCFLAATLALRADDLSAITHACGKPSETPVDKDADGEWYRIVEYKASDGAVVDVNFSGTSRRGPWVYQNVLYAVDKFPCLAASGIVTTQAQVPATPAISHPSSESGGVGLGLILIALAAALYFFPAALASHRNCKATGGIVVVNIFLGWTFIGWVVALAWAASGETHPKPLPAAPAR
jgi:hypothetical protein